MNYMQRLCCLAINDTRYAEELARGGDSHIAKLDAKTVALVRLAALIAVGGAVPSYGAHADAAIGAGATADEIVDVLVGVVPAIGLPRVVAAAPKLSMALGFDTEESLGRQSDASPPLPAE